MKTLNLRCFQWGVKMNKAKHIDIEKATPESNFEVIEKIYLAPIDKRVDLTAPIPLEYKSFKRINFT